MRNVVVFNASCPNGDGGHLQKSQSFEDKGIMHVGWGPEEGDLSSREKLVKQALETLNKSPYIFPYYSAGAYGCDGKVFKGIYTVGETEKVTTFDGWKTWMDAAHLNGRQFNGEKSSMTDEEAKNWFRDGGIGIFFLVEKISDYKIYYEEGVKEIGLPYRNRFCVSRKCAFNAERDKIVDV